MPLRRALLALVCAACLAAACSGDDEAADTTADTTPAETSTTVEREPCEDETVGPPLTEDRDTQAGTAASTANAIEDIRFGQGENCERIVLDFGTGGPLTSPLPESTDVPAYAAIDATDEGMLRLDLPALEWAAIAHLRPEDSDLVADVFVVRRPSIGGATGTVHVDLLLEADVKWRTFELQNPGRIVIDLVRIGDLTATPAVVAGPAGGEVVLSSPRAGATTGREVDIVGYARPFEGAILLRAVRDGEPLLEHVANTTDWTTMYGEFHFTASLEPGAVMVEAVQQADPSTDLEDVTAAVEVTVEEGAAETTTTAASENTTTTAAGDGTTTAPPEETTTSGG